MNGEPEHSKRPVLYFFYKYDVICSKILLLTSHSELIFLHNCIFK